MTSKNVLNNQSGLDEVGSAKNPELVSYSSPDMLKALERKARGIVAAIYMVTGFLPSDDPLRKSLRESALELLSFIFSMSAKIFTNTDKAVEECELLVGRIISMLEVAHYSGYISDMNFRILSDELTTFTSENNFFRSVLRDNFSFNIGGNKSYYKGHPDSTDTSRISKIRPKTRIKSISLSDRPEKSRVIRKIPPSLNETSPVFAKKQSRKEQIISILKRDGKVTIKGISSRIDGCSEKTIQRELISMIEQKIVKKDGERRWSMYSLIQL